jgi:two-component system response regulator RpaA
MRRKILVIDDEPDQLDLVDQVLTDEGFAIDRAANGLEGLTKMDQSRPDLVVVDASMPQMNGFTFCETVRRNPGTATIPIIMLTGLRGRLDQLNALAHGANVCLGKPFILEELVAKITELLKK